VLLQLRQGTTWATAAKAKTTNRGRFSFRIPTARAGVVILRVRVPKRTGARAATCAPQTLTVVAGGESAKVRPSFRAVYALASDQTAKPDAPAAIAGTADEVNRWFATQTTGAVQPRWIRDDTGAIAVTTVKLDHTAAQYAEAGDNFDMVAADLEAHGLVDGLKIAVWIDITNSGACGESGGATMLFFEAACDIYPAAGDSFPFGSTYLLAHEMTHGFGAVESCAPHAGAGGHVIDDPRDLLYAGEQPRDWDHITLDPGHDDYYETGRSDCPGIESSPFWTASSDPAS
jgi:hypothetical protein